MIRSHFAGIVSEQGKIKKGWCNTADKRHPGDEFPVSQRGSTKGKQSTNALV